MTIVKLPVKVKMNETEFMSDGNAFVLMGKFASAAQRQGISKEDIDSVLDACKSGDYDNLLVNLVQNIEFTNSNEEE